MALQTSMSIGDLKKRNEASKAARDTERSGTSTNGQQNQGR
ncbi:hypothetical protein [Streptomyces griseus]